MKSILLRNERESKQWVNKIVIKNCQSRDPTEICFASVSRNLKQNRAVFYSAIRDGVTSKRPQEACNMLDLFGYLHQTEDHCLSSYVLL